MDSYLKTVWYGVFLYTPEEILTVKLFPKNPEEVAKRLTLIKNKEILPEERQVAGETQPYVAEKRLKGIGKMHSAVPSLPATPEEYGFTQDILHAATLQVTRKEVDKQLGKKERQIAQAVNAVDELLHVSNLLMERLREWYGAFFPAALNMDGKTLAALVEKESEADLEKRGVLYPPALKSVADLLQRTYRTRDTLEEYIGDWMPRIAPNISQMVGPTLGARLIALAGSLEQLAMIPAGTIQLLGAENALFRHLKEGTAPPKHGILFQHELINKAPFWQRGKIARSFAAKIAIAAKADAFTQRDIAADLQKELDERVTTIRKQYPKPKH